jgi:hypothetical protein
MEWMDRRPRSTKHAIVEQQRVFPKQPAVLREWPIFYRVGRPNQRRYTFPDRSYTMSIEKVLYRAHARATGGRDGRAVVPDSGLDLRLTTPRELGGAGGDGANPEQLFAAGYSACFIGAMKFVAARDKIALPQDVSISMSG